MPVSAAQFQFLSTLSLRRATISIVLSIQPISISIHALLAESDGCLIMLGGFVADFYPRSPCGERQVEPKSKGHPLPISIHALLAESDGFLLKIVFVKIDFYPRSPCGERPAALWCFSLHSGISIHALLAESDTWSVNNAPSSYTISIHALLAESDKLFPKRLCDSLISIHALLAESDCFSAR